MGRFTEEIDSITQRHLKACNPLRAPNHPFRDLLSAWELEYILHQLDTYDTYGPMMKCSAKQRNRIAEIAEKLHA